MDFIRLGQVHKILPELQSYSAQIAAEGIKTVSELRRLYESKVMLLSFIKRSFHFVIMIVRFPSMSLY